MISRQWRSLLIFLAVWLGVAAAGRADTNLPPFAYSFDVTRALIDITPYENWNVFREADSVTISTVSNTLIRVLSRDGQVVYSGAPTTRQFTRGHYFVETPGDRTQFAVLPNDYGIQSELGVHDTGTWPLVDSIK